MRGYGDSEKPEKLSEYRLNVLVEDVRDIIRQLGNINYYLVKKVVFKTFGKTVINKRLRKL